MAFCALIFAAACYLLAFGGLIFCCAPTPRRTFWHAEKFFYGVLPICVSVATFVFTLRIWGRTYVRRRNAWLVGFLVAIVAVVLDVRLFLKYRGTRDDGIK